VWICILSTKDLQIASKSLISLHIYLERDSSIIIYFVLLFDLQELEFSYD